MLASMIEVFYTKHEAMTTTYEMIESLQAMFGQHFEQKWHEVVHSAMTARMKEGPSVWEHVLGMKLFVSTLMKSMVGP